MEFRSILQITPDPFKVYQKRSKGGQMAPNMIPNGLPNRHKIQRKSDWLHLDRRPPPKAATGLPRCSQMAPIMYRKASKCLQKLFKMPNLEDMRPLYCQLGFCSKSDGSAQLSQGQTTVLSGVFGPVEVKRNREKPDKMDVEVTILPRTGQSCLACRGR